MTPEQEFELLRLVEALRQTIINLHGVLFKNGTITPEDFQVSAEELQDYTIVETQAGIMRMEEQEKNDGQQPR